MKHQKDTRYSLDGEWQLTWASDEVLRRDGYRSRRDDRLTTPALCSEEALLQTQYDRVPAHVPGNFELDLYRAGRCEDPFFGTNVIRLQEYECMHQYYSRSFTFEGDPCGMELCFEGIDTAAEIFLNGKPIYECENMFLVHTVNVEDFLQSGKNELVVHIKPATIYARRYPTDSVTTAQYYNFASLSLRKAAGTYGWDILPRIVSGGLWRSVYLQKRKQEGFVELFAYTLKLDRAKDIAKLGFAYQIVTERDSLQDYRIEIEGACGESRFEKSSDVWHTGGTVRAEVKSPKLWMPRNYGEPHLYEVRVRLMHGDECVDEIPLRVGIRTVVLDRTSVVIPDGTRFGQGRFSFLINGEPIFAMGTNWVPVDAFHSRDRERLPEILPMLTDLGCNMVRMWGGNVYEDEALFDFCDENGILIWQDFAMGCGGYPQDADFAKRLAEEAEQIVKKYRNHPSLALWAGDNECDIVVSRWEGTQRRDPNTNLLTRRVLPDVLARHDMTRPYLPSSPYVDEEAYRTGYKTTEDHTWGPRDYFKGNYYRNTVCRFASEVGYHGCNEPESLARFLSPEALWPWRRSPEVDLANDEWLAHATCSSPNPTNDSPYVYRIRLMAKHVIKLFGSEPSELERFCIASQISQAEAKKYFIESYRIQRAVRTGILWWNLIDGWPQLSDAIVDYYGNKKLAYAYVKRAQAALALMCDEPCEGEIALVCVSDLVEKASVKWRVSDVTEGCVPLCAGEVYADPHTAQTLAKLAHTEGDRRFYLLEWEYSLGGERVCGRNHFVSGMEQTIDLDWYIDCMKRAGYYGDGFFLKEETNA